MNYRLEKLDSFNVIGMNYYGDPFSTGGAWSVDNAIGKLWSRFGTYLYNKSSNISHRQELNKSYEFHIFGDDLETSGEYSIMIGVGIESTDNQPIDLVIKSVKSHEYLIIELRGEDIVSDCMKQVQEIVDKQGDIEIINEFMFQVYDERFKGMDRIEESVIDAYFPIKRKPV